MKAAHIGAFEAKTRLSEILEQVRLGRVYHITRRGRAIAELRPIVEDAPDRLVFGCDRGQVVVNDDFDAPIPGFDPYRR
jgi:antitoxin (DNA-binding transcriptional repressor) of toxin-antitoxin stability system